jgi:ferredoxin
LTAPRPYRTAAVMMTSWNFSALERRCLVVSLYLLVAILLTALAPVAAFGQSGRPEVGVDRTGDTSHSQLLTDSAAQSSSLADRHQGLDKVEDETPGIFDYLLTLKYIFWFAFMAVGVILLLLKGINRWVRLGVMVAVFVLFGLDMVFSVHPSPMCGVTKLFTFRFTQGEFPPVFMAIFLAIFIPSLLGRKLFCGWVCPLGAFQELVNKIPFKWRWKQFNFGVFNGIRLALLIMFFFTIFQVKWQLSYLGEEAGNIPPDLLAAYSAYSIYDPVNFFELLHRVINPLWWVMVTALVLASLALYRPFCYSICPIGAISWLLEKVAPGRIRIDRKVCNDCQVCVIKSPCPTIKPMLEGENFSLPDCTSCGECVGTCNRKAIKFSFTR